MPSQYTLNITQPSFQLPFFLPSDLSVSSSVSPLSPLVSRLSGCYESLDGGNTGDAVVDFSGAVTEAINLEAEVFHKDQEKIDNLFEDLLKVYDRGGIISCSIKVCLLN